MLPKIIWLYVSTIKYAIVYLIFTHPLDEEEGDEERETEVETKGNEIIHEMVVFRKENFYHLYTFLNSPFLFLSWNDKGKNETFILFDDPL